LTDPKFKFLQRPLLYPDTKP